VLAALAACVAAGPAALGLDLVKEGRAQATIVVAEDAGMWQTAAAAYLRDYVQEASGCRLAIVKDSEAPTGALVSVGRTRLSERDGIRADGLKWDGCRLVVKGSVLHLIGRDVDPLPACRSIGHLRGAGAQGTARAAALFLEKFVGVRWFLPTTEGVVIPSMPDIAVPDSLDLTSIPTFAYTSISIHFPRPLDYIAMNQREAIRFRSFGGHSWYEHVPVKKYFEEHPEFFWLNAAGTRMPTGEHLCTTNAEVRRIMLREIRALFDAGYDLVQLGQTDGWRACLCRKCMALDDHADHRQVTLDNPCRKVWDIHQWIIDQCKASHPRKMIRAMIYGPTWAPPKDWTGLRDNVIGEVAPFIPERLAAWEGKLAGIVNWTYWWHAATLETVFVPATPPQFLQERYREFRDANVIGMTGDPQGQWGLGGPSHYVFCKLIGDVDADVDALVHDYCMGVYGEVGWIMKRFFNLFHQRAAMAVPLKEMKGRARTGAYPAEEAFTLLYPPKVVHQLDRLLTRAERKAESPRAKGWLKLTRDELDGLKAVVGMFVHKRAFEVAPTRERLAAVKQAVDVFEAWRERIIFYPEEYARKWFPQHNELCAILLTDGRNMTADWAGPNGPPSYYRFHYRHSYLREEIQAIRDGKKTARGRALGSDLGARAIHAPITWDFDALAASIGKPEKEMRIVARRVKGAVKLDGRLAPAEWGHAESHPFQRYQAAGSKLSTGATTSVRLLYDDSLLYIGYECREPRIDNLKLTPVGRDGNVYHSDEIEFFLNTDPDSDRKVMQFMASPLANAFYDARRGFIEDPLHPDYNNWEKTTWNPDWTYAFHVDREAKTWSIEMAMPFASLDIAPPQPGTVWTCNFARARRAGAEELSSWVPDTFGKRPELFGELLFGNGPAPKTPAAPAKQAAPEVADPGNLVVNGGFEHAAIGGRPTDWHVDSYPASGVPALLDRCSTTREKARSGQRAFKVDFAEVDFAKTGNATQILFQQRVDAARIARLRGKKARLSFWVYYEVMSDEASDNYFPGPTLRVRCWSGGKPLDPDAVPAVCVNHRYLAKAGGLAAFDAAPRWVKFEHVGAIPQQTQTMDVHGGLVGHSRRTGKSNQTLVYIDDVRLEIVE